MENTSYGINVANRYDLFCIEDDAGDPIESILKNKQKQQQQKKQQAQQNAGATAATPAAGGGGAQPQQQQQQQAAQSKSLAKGGEKENKAAGAGGGRGAENRHPDKSAAAQTNGTGNHLHNQRGGAGAGASGPGGERRGIKETQKDNIRNQENQKTGAGNQTSKFPRGGGGAGGPTNKSAGANDDKYPRKPRDSDPDRKQQPYAQNGVKQRFEGGRGKRELDRQSGSNKTGIKAVDKRDGAGSHNWGSSKQDAKEFSNLQEQDYHQAQDADTSAEEKQPQTDRSMNGQAAGGEGETGDAGNAKSEDEAKEMTLDEWKAQKAAVRLKPQYNLRKAGEGENSAQWDKMVALNKKAADGEDDEGNDTQKTTTTTTTTAATAAPVAGGNKNKQVLDIEFHFNDNRRGGLGRGRGGGRGGGKGGPRGGGGIGREGGPGGRREYGAGGGGENNYRSGGEGGAGGYEHRGGGPGAAADGATDGGERPPRRNNRPPGGGGGAGAGGYEGGVNKYSRPNPRPPKQHFVAAPKVDDEHDFPSLG
uniref:Putative rna-binding protein n=1 Tax=Anopheles braziliensis TaxID=58242 RepID=A0A2M3YY22_9DIPT